MFVDSYIAYWWTKQHTCIYTKWVKSIQKQVIPDDIKGVKRSETLKKNE